MILFKLIKNTRHIDKYVMLEEKQIPLILTEWFYGNVGVKLVPKCLRTYISNHMVGKEKNLRGWGT